MLSEYFKQETGRREFTRVLRRTMKEVRIEYMRSLLFEMTSFALGEDSFNQLVQLINVVLDRMDEIQM